MEIPDVKYARSGDVAVAYQVLGEGPLDLVFVRGTLADLLAGWDQPLFVDHVEGLARFSRVLLFDKRGSGLSDPVRQVPTLETRMDDIRAVMDAAGSERAVLWAAQEGSRIALLFAATYPERTSALVCYDPTARGLWAPDYPWAPTAEDWRSELREIHDRWGDREYLAERVNRLAPSVADDEAFVDWFVWYMRRSASPAEAVSFHRMSMEGDVRDVLTRSGRRRSCCIAPRRARRPLSSPNGSGARAESRSRDSATGSVGPIRNGTSSCSGRRSSLSKGSLSRRSPTGFSRPCSSPTSSTPRARPRSSATAAGVSSFTGTTHWSAASLRAFAGRSSTRVGTASSRLSTDRAGRSSARVRSARRSARSDSRFAPACTRANASVSKESSAG